MNKRRPKPTAIGCTLSLVLATILAQTSTAFGQTPPSKTDPPGVQNVPDVAQGQAAATPESDASARTAPAPAQEILATAPAPAADLTGQRAKGRRTGHEQLVRQLLQLDRAVRAAIEEYHNQENAQLRKRIRAQLQTLVENQFDQKLVAQQRELERLSEQLAVVKQKISRRQELKEAIVQRRIVELMEVGPEELQPGDEGVATWDATGRTLNSEESISLTEAVSRFNESNEAERIKRGEAPLTVHEIRAALVHEKKHLSAESQQIADDILATDMLPPTVGLYELGRHFADRHVTYIWNIKLFFDKGSAPVDHSGSSRTNGKRRVGESLVLRKRYIATQMQRYRDELKPLEQLVGPPAVSTNRAQGSGNTGATSDDQPIESDSSTAPEIPTSPSALLDLQTDPSTVAGLKAQLDVAKQLVEMKKAQYLIGKLTLETVTEAEAAHAAANTEYQQAVRQLELRKKLLTWEIQKGELDCQAARNTWERMQKLEKNAPGTLPHQELDAARLAMRKAELNLQQLQAIAASLEEK
jgi:hypothetical protein